MVDYFTILGVISALSVMIPGFVVLARFGIVKVSLLRNLTILLSLFAIIHGFYHLLLLAGAPVSANIVDFITVAILILIGAYYNAKVG